MSLELLVLCLAAAALIAWSTSALVGLAAPAITRTLGAATPQTRARVWLLLAFAPATLAVIVVVATLGPVPGLVTDHCLAHGPHHPHLCLTHGSTSPGLALVLLAAALGLRLLVSAGRAALLARRSAGTVRSLEAASVEMGSPSVLPSRTACVDGVRILPSSGPPQALVAGLLRPRMFVSRALLESPHADVVIAHERVHICARHALGRWLAGLALAWHLPGVGAAVGRHLALAHEMLADEEAGHSVGDRTRVAEALVHVARETRSAPAGTLAFGVHDLEARVRALLRDGPTRPMPGGRALLTLGTLCVACAIGLGADPLHHALETLLGILGG